MIFRAKYGVFLVALSASAMFNGVVGAVVIPNANFDTLYKPGSVTITATNLGGGYTVGIGPNVPLGFGTANFSDSTTGNHVDVPGWTGINATGVQEFQPANAQFPFGTDTLPYGVYVQGPGFGGSSNTLVTSGGLGALAANTDYVLSIQVGWRNDITPPASPIVLNLNANGFALTPDLPVSPTRVQGSFVTYSRTYDAISLIPFVTQQLTISFGVGASASGLQAEFDSVKLTDTAIPVPEPASLVLFGLGAFGLFLAAGRRRKP